MAFDFNSEFCIYITSQRYNRLFYLKNKSSKLDWEYRGSIFSSNPFFIGLFYVFFLKSNYVLTKHEEGFSSLFKIICWIFWVIFSFSLLCDFPEVKL